VFVAICQSKADHTDKRKNKSSFLMMLKLPVLRISPKVEIAIDRRHQPHHKISKRSIMKSRNSKKTRVKKHCATIIKNKVKTYAST